MLDVYSRLLLLQYLVGQSQRRKLCTMTQKPEIAITEKDLRIDVQPPQEEPKIRNSSYSKVNISRKKWNRQPSKNVHATF